MGKAGNRQDGPGTPRSPRECLGAVWHLDVTGDRKAKSKKPLGKRDLRPLAIEWGGQALDVDGTRSNFAIATSLSNVCKLLDVELVNTRNRGVSGYWGRTGHIEGRGRRVLGNACDLGRGHEQEHGAGVDEAVDEPRTGHADDLWSRSRHPDRSSLIVTARDLRRSHQRLTALAPSIVAAFKGLSFKALMAKPRGDSLT